MTFSLRALLTSGADERPDEVVLTHDDDQLTWAMLQDQSRRVASALVRDGVRPGSRVAYLGKNGLPFFPYLFGCALAGAVAMPLNWRLAPREIAAILDDGEAAVVLVDDELTALFEQVERDLTRPATVVTLADEHSRWQALRSWLGPAEDPGARPAPDDVALQLYTSGTTGRPKGAVLTQRAADANLTQIRTALSLHHTTRNLLTSPMFHTASAVNLFAGWAAGLTAYMIIDFDADGCARFIDDEKITMVSLAPAMIQAMLVGSTALRERRFDALRTVLYGASAINEATLRQILEVFHADFYQAYGQTEATALLTMLGPEDHRRALDGDPALLRSAGRPVVGVELRVTDTDGADCPPGTVGEILARGPQVMSGYWNLPEVSEHALAGGWLHTGDAGYFDDDGYLYICDRVKDMIVSGAENVFPKEIEDVIYQLDGVAEAAVIGVPSQRWGETVKAVVVSRPGAMLTEDEVIAWCRGRLAGYKCPRSVDLVDELPRNAAGKVLKRVLREPYWLGEARQVG
jgi:acyl-CoA synthetase (AMP-forming)/AMP-acid ligase II